MIDKATVEYTHLMPCEAVEILEHPEGIVNDSAVVLKLKKGPLAIPWRLKIFDVQDGKSFSDKQIRGPFLYWQHCHQMQSINENNSLLIEKINFKLPILGSIGEKIFAAAKLKKLFKYRFKVIENDIKMHYKYKDKKAMRILVTGTSGLVGTALTDYLSAGGHEVFKLVRAKPKSEREIQWTTTSVESQKLEGFDAVVHLAGENIAAKRWTQDQKNKIYDSRVQVTKFLAETLSKLKEPPKVFVCASAIGFYGDRGDQLLDESSAPAGDFLGKTCQDWEQATNAQGIRVVNARFGIILDPRGGALAKMLPLFQLGGGGTLGNGKQYMSWIALDDVIGAIYHCLRTESIAGPVNFVAPNAITNKEFTKVLAKVLNRPAIFPAPALALKLVLGEMADALLLSSTRVQSRKLEETKYEFAFPGLEAALRHMLGK